MRCQSLSRAGGDGAQNECSYRLALLSVEPQIVFNINNILLSVNKNKCVSDFG